MDTILKDLHDYLACKVREGFDTEEEIIEDAGYYASETHDRDGLTPEIERLTAELLSAHQKEQETWTFPTDCDRLNVAFASLNQQGIVARQNFACCNTCGFAEIWDEITEAETQQTVEGYVFYHFQGTERAIETGELYLAYGSIAEEEAALFRIASSIVAELRKAGLNASWSGDSGHAIRVNDMVWRRRREA